MEIYKGKTERNSLIFFLTPGTVVLQAPLSMGFPRQEYWTGLPFPSPGKLVTFEVSFLLEKIH